jgi:hypothetical protein
MPGHSWLADGQALLDLKPKAVTPESETKRRQLLLGCRGLHGNWQSKLELARHGTPKPRRRPTVRKCDAALRAEEDEIRGSKNFERDEGKHLRPPSAVTRPRLG